MQKVWLSDKKLHSIHIEVLQAMLRESIQVVENVEVDGKFQKGEIKLKIRDAQINKLKEQVIFRDELIDEARRMLKSAGVRQELDDRRIVDVEDMFYEGQVVVKDHQFDGNNVTGYNRGANNGSRLSQNNISPHKQAYGGYSSNTGVGKYGSNDNGYVKRRMLGVGGQGQREIDRLERIE